MFISFFSSPFSISSLKIATFKDLIISSDSFIFLIILKLKFPSSVNKSDEIIDQCTFPMVNEALLILEEGMAQRPSDIDVVWLNGYGFPRDKGGLLFWANKIGSARILEGLRKIEDSGSEINISEMLKDMVKKNENIFDKQDQKIRV